MAVYRTKTSFDVFINTNNDDGDGLEGPGCWGMAAGKLYDYLKLLSYVTNGTISIFNNILIKKMGEYVLDAYMGNGFVSNFGDGLPKVGFEIGLIYRYGKSTNSTQLMEFASHLYQRSNDSFSYNIGSDMFRTLDNALTFKDMLNTKGTFEKSAFSWYPDTKLLYMGKLSFFSMAIRAGNNGESHCHNDAGSFILAYNGTPIFLDPGMVTYTSSSFSNLRSTNWFIQSDYHNLPIINGLSQQSGKSFYPQGFTIDTTKSESVNKWIEHLKSH